MLEKVLEMTEREVGQWDAEVNVTAGSGATYGPSPRQFFSSCST